MDWNSEMIVLLFQNKIMQLDIGGKTDFFMGFICHLHIEREQIVFLPFRCTLK
jgi:hypothetical protein